MRKLCFSCLSVLNRALLPKMYKRDLMNLSKVEQAIVGWKMWVTYRLLDASDASDVSDASRRKR
jgi:hypothetical protein